MVLKNLFTSNARIQILSLFLLGPDSELYLREVSRRTGLNLNSVRRELENLERAGILRSSRKGNLKIYSTNPESPIRDELKRIFLKTIGIGDFLRTRIHSLGKIKRAFIYGSFARGDQRATSDIDVFILGQVDQHKTASLFEQLQNQLSREINYVIFSPDEFEERKKKHDPFLTNVLKQKKIILVEN